VFVKALDGKTIVCRIRMDQPIQKLKDIIYDKQGIPPEQQSLTFEGKQLAQDTWLLKDYYIKSNDTVNLTVRLMGG
ncbi:ubiquitin, partial [Fennellomyces sp. T-0311]